jgi:hypothetical protein
VLAQFRDFLRDNETSATRPQMVCCIVDIADDGQKPPWSAQAGLSSWRLHSPDIQSLIQQSNLKKSC